MNMILLNKEILIGRNEKYDYSEYVSTLLKYLTAQDWNTVWNT